MPDKISVGLMGAMNEEVISLKNKLKNISSEIFGEREYIKGTLEGIETVLVFSRWGKVAASSTATILITRYNVNCLIFTGAAGAISHELNIGDIVIGAELYQHDMDASPLFKKHEIPLTGISKFKANEYLIENAKNSSILFVNNINSFFKDENILEKFSIRYPKVTTGLIASGDQFIHSSRQTLEIKEYAPDALAVEMEGAAVAQVCHEHKIPFVIIRIISDKAYHNAAVEFPAFVKEIMSEYSAGIVQEMYRQGLTEPPCSTTG